MEKDFRSIAKYWRSVYSSNIERSEKFDLPNHFKKMVGLMAPGKSFYYIVNFHTLELELLSDSIVHFMGVSPKEVDMHHLLSLALPEEVENIQNKEKVIQAFMIDYLHKSEIMDYKVMYTYKMRDYEGTERLMLHQASILSTTEEGRFVHVFSIHTDISHLAITSTEEVSFINVNGEKDYLNVCSKAGTFDPESLIPEQNLKDLLSDREVEIIRKMAEGLNSDEVARDLYISPYTVKTHRKNILKKAKCKNSMQLISKCIATGIVSPVL